MKTLKQIWFVIRLFTFCFFVRICTSKRSPTKIKLKAIEMFKPFIGEALALGVLEPEYVANAKTKINALYDKAKGDL